ncbi:hypothetical protein SAMN04487833_13337 [Sarcina sp. DSM 11001]|uniref:hypothetical protein n=1 Tax=Sarcina sp. DSM 11001 TaxID=1798184 RepID=UPI000892213E|nr:hypothetical protein [Sarcina sp. DSM 11001]SDL82778.1 hypothetical protein SAMN04487833_13337 [Sarcina sp. DSM 11001]
MENRLATVDYNNCNYDVQDLGTRGYLVSPSFNSYAPSLSEREIVAIVKSAIEANRRGIIYVKLQPNYIRGNLNFSLSANKNGVTVHIADFEIFWGSKIIVNLK